MRVQSVHPCLFAFIFLSFTTSSRAQDIEALAEQVSNLKAQEVSSQEEQQSFDIEQAEFEKMRMQLIQKEREILDSADTTAATGDIGISLSSTATSPRNHGSESPLNDSNDQIENSTHILKKQLAERTQEIASLRAELQDLRNKLLVAESEIERISRIEPQNTSNNINSGIESNDSNSDSQAIFSTANQRTNKESQDESTTIVTVVSDSGALRTAPNATASIIMEVDSGARLTVDDRRGDWFRISTSSGMRAWISATEVAFGPSDSASPSNTVRIRPSAQEQYAEEERAFQLLKNR